MSWDIFVQDLPAGAANITEIPDDFRPRAILPRARIEEVFRLYAPFADFSNPSLWQIDCAEFSIEVSINEEDPSPGFALHIRGGEEVIGFLEEVFRQLGVRALDPSSETGFFDPKFSAEGLRRWQAWRDKVLKGSPNGAGK